jgi:hypothetical protein
MGYKEKEKLKILRVAYNHSSLNLPESFWGAAAS